MTPQTPPDDDTSLAQALRASRALEDAPEDLVLRAIALFPAAAAATMASVPGRLRRLVAQLSFDSAASLAGAAALRAAAAPGAIAVRQVLYSADGRDVDLRLVHIDSGAGGDGPRWRLSGQVLGPDERGQAELRSAAGDLRQTAWSELAEFSFDDLPAGEWTLVLRGGDWELALPALLLAPAP
jgi:hypothetical protein